MNLKDPRTSMVEALLEAVANGVELLVAVSDSTTTSKISPFAAVHPDRVVNVGIAEQNLIGMAAGLSLGGYVVVTANAASFLVSRSAEQVKNDIAYTGTNVKMMGLNPGFAYGSLGPTHHSIEDISAMRSMAGMTILTPIDPSGTARAVKYALITPGPVYIRVDAGDFQDFPETCSREIGEPVRLSEGNDLTIIGLGTAAHAVSAASNTLAASGISADTWGIPSIRPLNTVPLIASIVRTGKVITVEAHSVHGGLGSLIAEIMAEERILARLQRLGIPEGVFAPASPRSSIESKYRLDAEGIAASARLMLAG